MQTITGDHHPLGSLDSGWRRFLEERRHPVPANDFAGQPETRQQTRHFVPLGPSENDVLVEHVSPSFERTRPKMLPQMRSAFHESDRDPRVLRPNIAAGQTRHHNARMMTSGSPVQTRDYLRFCSCQKVQVVEAIAVDRLFVERDGAGSLGSASRSVTRPQAHDLPPRESHCRDERVQNLKHPAAPHPCSSMKSGSHRLMRKACVPQARIAAQALEARCRPVGPCWSAMVKAPEASQKARRG